MIEILLYASIWLFGFAIGVAVGTIAGASTHHKYEERNCRGKHT